MTFVDHDADGSVWAIGPHASVPDTDSAVGAWFLGPRAENADELERLLLEALRDHVFWRRNFHPEDPVAITEEMKRSHGYVVARGSVREQFQAMLALLKKSVPWIDDRSDTSKRSFIDTIADVLRRTAVDVARSRPWARQGTA